ncbi:hypothetical protein ES703_106028 [subsurface metagenome]
MIKLETRALIRAFIEEENREQLFYFKALGSKRGRHYTDNQKDYAVHKAISIGVRATSRLLNMPRRTIQRWLRANGITVKRCPDWVYSWAYWRNKRREKWDRIKAYRGY